MGISRDRRAMHSDRNRLAYCRPLGDSRPPDEAPPDAPPPWPARPRFAFALDDDRLIARGGSHADRGTAGAAVALAGTAPDLSTVDVEVAELCREDPPQEKKMRILEVIFRAAAAVAVAFREDFVGQPRRRRATPDVKPPL
jgi:hypothetical protein